MLSSLALTAATVTTGLTAGLYVTFSHTIMPALHDADDKVFVDVMNRFIVVILNGWFYLSLLGAVGFILLAGILELRGGSRAAVPWIVAGFVLYLVMFVITMAVNVPLNDQLATIGSNASAADYAAFRADFEDRWVTWNVIRTVATVAAFACLAWALVVHGTHRGIAAPPPHQPAAVPAHQHPSAVPAHQHPSAVPADQHQGAVRADQHQGAVRAA